MITAQYLHCSSAGSYRIDCEILEKRNYDFNIDAPRLEQLLIEKGLPLNKPDYGSGYVIKYIDPIINETVTKWVSAEYLNIPKFVGPI